MSFLSILKSKEDFHQTNFGTNTITASLWAIHHQTHKRAHVSWSDLENMMNFDHFHIPNTHQEFTFLCSANCCGVLTVLWQTSYVSHTTRHTRLTRVNMVFLLSRMGWLGCIAHSTWLFQSPFSRTENNLEVIFKKSHIKYEFFHESFYFSKL